MDFRNMDLSTIDLKKLNEEERKEIQAQLHIILFDKFRTIHTRFERHMNENNVFLLDVYKDGTVPNNIASQDDIPNFWKYYSQCRANVQADGFDNGEVVAVIDQQYFRENKQGLSLEELNKELNVAVNGAFTLLNTVNKNLDFSK